MDTEFNKNVFISQSYSPQKEKKDLSWILFLYNNVGFRLVGPPGNFMESGNCSRQARFSETKTFAMLPKDYIFLESLSSATTEQIDKSLDQ